MQASMLTLALIGAVTASPAFAGSISQTQTVSTASPTMGTLNYFDSTLGSLTSVMIQTTFSVGGSYSISNPSTTEISGKSGIGANVLVVPTSSSQMLNNALEDLVSGLPSYTAYATYDLQPGASQTTLFDSGLLSGSAVDTKAADLMALTHAGGGSFDTLAALGVTNVVFQPNGTYSANSNVTGAGSFTLTYNYTPVEVAPPANNGVPEPATWAMMLVGFGMVGAGLRYRRKRTIVRFA